ncbi:hypothetical protein [Burkholderia gladioli]|uniref:hypothetical protein n=1 Tax=Burkholderia gladioli TaxID=28095 RepID=UPI001641FFC6|nr:hypothetical protein [Burkholderia gladioli]
MIRRREFWLLIAGFFVGVFAMAFVRWPPTQSSDWASWAQAVGAIAAIIGAFFLAQRQAALQHQSAIALEYEARLRRWQSVKALLDSLYQQCLDVDETFNREGGFSTLDFVGVYEEKAFVDSINRLNGVPLFDLNSDKLVFAIIGIKDDAESLNRWIQEGCRRGPGFSTDLKASDYWVKKVAVGRLESIKSHYSDAIAVTGGLPISTPRQAFWMHSHLTKKDHDPYD